jgi:DNA-binding transcriptional ArsR family regulator
MHDVSARSVVRQLGAQGRTPAEITASTGLPLSTVQRWLTRRLVSDDHPPPRCPRCDAEPIVPETAAAYAYLLGQYLGDGHLVTSSRVPVLRIYACTDYPGILDQIMNSIDAVRGRRPGRVASSNSDRVISLQSYWNHWPCLLPQHGPGRKHERPIRLEPWQQAILDEHPWPLIRGLIHSDGCRAINRVVAHGVRYSYPRYFFSNESADIRQIMGDALDRVGVAWRPNRRNSLSVARRDAVAAMDLHVGPKR